MTYPYGGDPRRVNPGYQPPSGYEPLPVSPSHGYYQPALPAPYEPAPYGPPPYGYGPPAGYGPMAARPQRSAGAAVALEIVLGIFGIFGVGNLYAGRVGLGIALMVSFWVLFWINFLLTFVFIGFVTYPLTWIAFLIVGPVAAARGVERYNSRS